MRSPSWHLWETLSPGSKVYAWTTDSEDGGLARERNPPERIRRLKPRSSGAWLGSEPLRSGPASLRLCPEPLRPGPASLRPCPEPLRRSLFLTRPAFPPPHLANCSIISGGEGVEGGWLLRRPGLKTRATLQTKSRLKPAQSLRAILEPASAGFWVPS